MTGPALQPRPSTVLPRPLRIREVLALSLRRRRRESGFWFGTAIAILWPFTMFGARVAFGGAEHLPRTGGALLACNHVSDVDPVYDVAYVISHGRMPRFLAKAELWQVPVVRWVMAGGRHIPVHRASTRAADAYKEAIEALQRGEVVVFYPEGTFTADPAGWPMKAKNGIGRIALTTGVPVIPVANWGTQELLPPDGRPRPVPRKTVQVVAGPPVDLSRWLDGPRTRTALDGVTAAIMADITALVAGLRGEEPPATPYDPQVAAVKAAAVGLPGAVAAARAVETSETPAPAVDPTAS
jgi:1-acyl-sn-glycerol-3-phosphate acyltransferase